MSIAKIIARFMGSIRILILAAILPQDQLGLFGIALIVGQFVEKLSQTGIRQALVQHPGKIDNYLGTAWVSQFSRGLLVAIVIFVCAGSMESFFDKEGLAELLAVFAVFPILQGFCNVGIVHLNRELKFEKIVLIELMTAFVDLASSVLLAWYLPVAMALVFGKLLGGLTMLSLGFMLERRWPDFSFSLSQFKELYKFGFWVFLSAVIAFTLIRGGDLVIAKYLPEADLAKYQVAYALACIPIMEIMNVVSKTTFSAYSRIQDDKKRLVNAFLRVLSLCSFVAVLSVVGMLALGNDFTKLFLKPNYAIVADLLPWLAVWGACRALGATNTSLFQGAGKPALATIFQVLMLVLFAIFLIPAAQNYGIVGIAVVLAGIGLVAQLSRYSLIIYIFKIKTSDIVIRIIAPIIAGLMAMVPCYLAMACFGPNQHLLRLIVGFVVVVGVFTAASVLIDKKFNFGVVEFIARRSKPIMNLAQRYGIVRSNAI